MKQKWLSIAVAIVLLASNGCSTKRNAADTTRKATSTTPKAEEIIVYEDEYAVVKQVEPLEATKYDESHYIDLHVYPAFCFFDTVIKGKIIEKKEVEITYKKSSSMTDYVTLAQFQINESMISNGTHHEGDIVTLYIPLSTRSTDKGSIEVKEGNEYFLFLSDLTKTDLGETPTAHIADYSVLDPVNAAIQYNANKETVQNKMTEIVFMLNQPAYGKVHTQYTMEEWIKTTDKDTFLKELTCLRWEDFQESGNPTIYEKDW